MDKQNLTNKQTDKIDRSTGGQKIFSKQTNGQMFRWTNNLQQTNKRTDRLSKGF